MTEETADSLKDLCRACMTSVINMRRDTRTTNHKQCISEKPAGCEDGPTIMELLQVVQPLIKVQMKDDLPKLMCVGCIQQLQLTHEFLELYRDSDEKFRKLLKEVYLQEESANSKDLGDSFDEFVGEPEHVDDIRGRNASASEITKFEIEIENLAETVSIQRDTLEIDEYGDVMNDWLEFEDEPKDNNEMDEEHDDVEKADIFDNPYSDASDNDWKPKENASNKQPTKVSPAKIRKSLIQSCPKRKITSKVKQKPSKECKTKKNSSKNLPVMNNDGSVSCQECETILENITIWREHMRGHHLEKSSSNKNDVKVGRPRKSYKCEYCSKVFQKTTAYKNHIRIHTGEEPYLCIECGKSFKVVSSLNTHMLRHKGEKTIQCPHCPKKFVCSSGLYGHMMVHNKDKPYVCDICGSAFHMAYMLKKHNLYHKGIRNFPCEYCDLRFFTAEKQRRHMRTHTGEKPYRCKYCDRAFAQSNDCNKHLKQHLGENIFQCELCPLRFPLVRDLRVHFATHKDDDEETRARNIAAREAEEKNLKIKLGVKDD